MSVIPRPTIRAVAFDLDGLMVNTEEIFNLVGHEVLRRRGKQMTPELLCQMMGRRAAEALQHMITAHSLEDTVEALQLESIELFTEFSAERLALMPGLLTLLDEIERRGLPKGVATSSSRGYLEAMLDRFNLGHRFQTTLTAEDVSHGKPHPEIYLTAAERLGVRPDELLVLEDSYLGTTAAVNAGAVAVSIPHPHSSSQDFGHAHCVADRLDAACILELLPG